VIRFSAVLVAVAVGMLAGGIATSKLLLVYLAIAVSAVALVALAIGVILNRQELFGEEQGAAPAQSDARPASSAQVGDGDDRNRPSAHVPPPLLGAAVGPGAAFAGYGQAGPPQAEGAAPRGAWHTGTGRDAWSAQATAASFPAGRPGAAPSGAPADGWVAPSVGKSPVPDDRAVPGSGPETGSRGAWAPPSAFAPPAAPPPSAASGVAPGIGRSSWFGPPDVPPSGDAPSPRSGTGLSWLAGDAAAGEGRGGTGKQGKQQDGTPAGNGRPEEATAGTAGNVPARHSWLSGEPEDGEPEDGKPQEEDGVPDGAALAVGAAPDDRSPSAPAAAAEDPADAVTAEAAGEPGNDDGTDRPELADRAELADRPEPADRAELTDRAEPAAPHPAPGPGAPAAGDEAESGPPAGADDLVTVIPGVPRFHQPDCVLIRFMPDGDTQKMPVAQAEEAGCTPCAACHPEA
jgi:hypothetical protein